jgi:spore maturation protein CgeB
MQDLKIYHIGLCATPGTNNGLQRAFRKVSQYKEVYSGNPDMNNQAVKDIFTFKPDIVFMQIQTPNVIHAETIKKIKPYCGKIINFTGDVRNPLPDWYIEIGKLIDLTLFVSMDDVQIARSKGIKADWLQLGFDESIYNDKVTPANTADIVFTANNYHHFPLSKFRSDIAHALYKEFKDRFILYGSGWTIKSLDSNHSMQKQAEVFRGCKIAINCSNYDHSMYVSDRMLKIMGAGAFCLSHNFKDHDKLYKDGENFAVFDSIPEMIELCHAFLENDQERNRIAKNGYDLTHKLYTWDCMINNLIKICEQ